MRKGLITTSIILVGLALYGMVESSRLERTMKMGVGVGFLPFWVSAILGFLALLLLIRVLRAKISLEDKPVFHRENIPRVISLLFILFFYLVFMEVIGYLASTFLFFSVTILFLRRSRVLHGIFFGGLFTILLYALFKIWLKSPLPTGFFNL